MFIQSFLTYGWGFSILCWSSVSGTPIDNGLVDTTIPGPNPLPTDSVGNVECKEVAEPFDLEVLIDGSSSVGEEDFKKIKRFVTNVLQGFTVGPNNVQVGIVQFSGTTRTEFSLNKYKNYAELVVGIDAITYLKGTTKTGAAITHVLNNELIVAKGKRPNVKTVITVLTDGSSQDNITEASANVRKLGYSLLAVAITPDVNFQQLQEMTGGDSSKVFQIDSFSDLQQTFRNTFVTKVCNEIKKNTTHIYVTASASNRSEAGPKILCAQNQIQILAETRKHFKGNVFVKGYSTDPNCKKSYITARTTTSIELSIDVSKCGVMRNRQLNPAGMSYETVVIISFHQLFITKVDRAFRVQCFFMEAQKTLTQSLDVSMLTTESLSHTAPMPICTYSTRRGSETGDVVRYASVGDKIFHIWQCSPSPGDTSAHYILVRNCQVDNGQGNHIKVLDEFGCTLDRYVMPDLSYDISLSKAVTETHAFKFADHNLLVFHICLKSDSGCASITPPKCGNSSTGHLEFTTTHIYATTSFGSEPLSYQPPATTTPIYSRLKDNSTVGTFDAFSHFSVLDVESSIESTTFEQNRMESGNDNFQTPSSPVRISAGRVCLTPAVVILFAGLIILVTVVISSCGAQYYLKRRHCAMNFLSDKS